MTTIAQKIQQLRSELKETPACLVAVSKYQPLEALQEAYDAGQRVFGESHVQELQVKQPALPQDIEWHFIGHLQTNKVKYIAPYISLVHSVDSFRLLCEIDKQGKKCGRTIDCLLQLHIAQEETKFGFSPDELGAMLAEGEWRQLNNIRVRGLMCMATNTDDMEQVRSEFRQAHQLFVQAKARHFSDAQTFDQLSMGMTDDYRIAIDEGSTLVRIGSKIFNKRPKK